MALVTRYPNIIFFQFRAPPRDANDDYVYKDDYDKLDHLPPDTSEHTPP